MCSSHSHPSRSAAPRTTCRRSAQRRKVAVVSGTTGYGTASVNAYVPMLKAKGAEVVYQGNVDAANPTSPALRMQSAGAEAIMPWSVMPVSWSHIINLARQIEWYVPIAARPRVGSGQTKALLEMPGILGEGYKTISAQFATPSAASSNSHYRLPRPFQDREDRHGRHASVVERARLRQSADDRRGDQERGPSRSKSLAISISSGFPGVYGYISFTPCSARGPPTTNSDGRGEFAQGRRAYLAPGYSA